MAQIGQFNFLKILRKSSRGTFLEGGNLGQIYLPAKLTPKYNEVGDKIQVFLYHDSHDEVVATTKKPRVEIGGIACLKVVSANQVGAFLDWGLPKDLFVPFGQQQQKMNVDEFHIVHVYEDNTGRVCGSSKLNQVVKNESSGLKNGDAVNLIVGSQTDLGYKMIVNGTYWGVLHKLDIFRELRYGQHLKGFIKKVRDDKKLDITLKQVGFQSNETLTDKIMQILHDNNGVSDFSDKSPPELIYQEFGVSKKVFKAALGTLYKQRKIEISPKGIKLVSTE